MHEKHTKYCQNVIQNAERKMPVKPNKLPVMATCLKVNLRNMAPLTMPSNDEIAMTTFTIVVVSLASKPRLVIRCL